MLLSLACILLPFSVAAFKLLIQTLFIPGRLVKTFLKTSISYKHHIFKKMQLGGKASLLFRHEMSQAIYLKCTHRIQTPSHSTDKDLDASLLLLFHGTKIEIQTFAMQTH